jgi:hypothetical protein
LENEGAGQMPIKRHKTHVSFIFPSDWKWEFERELQRLDQQRVKVQKGFRVSLSLLYTIALMEGIKQIRQMTLTDIEQWSQKHKI